MSATFISYRRNDSAGHTGRLYDHLCKALGEDSVFRDIDTIKPGVDFVEAVREGIQRCSTLIVVIGNQWLTAEDDSGRRLDHPLDYVRLEIGSALKQGIQVIPVLVEGAKMPDPTELPEEISPLARLQALQLSDDRWDYDIGRLISALDKSTKKREASKPQDKTTPPDKPKVTQPDTPPSTKDGSGETNRYGLVGAIAILLLLLGGIAIWSWSENPKGKNIASVTKKQSVSEKQNAPSLSDETGTDNVKQEVVSSNPPENNSIAPQNDKKIEQLLIEAEQNIANLQLTAPSGNNAVEKYNEILKLQPGHAKALLGLESVSRKYADLATQAITASKIKKADSYLRLAKSINPDIPEIARVERRLKSTQIKQQQEVKNALANSNGQDQTQLKPGKILNSQLACNNSCQSKTRDCKKLASPKNCASNIIQTACQQIQRECLRDPQTILTWGEFAANSECRTRYNQCEMERTNECTRIKQTRYEKCDSLESQCLKSC